MLCFGWGWGRARKGLQKAFKPLLLVNNWQRMPNNLYEGIKIFIVYVRVLALNTVVTLQLRSRLHLPASSQTPAGSWQRPRGLIVCESGQGAEPNLPLWLFPAARSSSSPRQDKNDLLTCQLSPERCWAWVSSGGCCSPHSPPSGSCDCWCLVCSGLLDKDEQILLKTSHRLKSFSLWFTRFQGITAVLICKAKQSHQTSVSCYCSSRKKKPTTNQKPEIWWTFIIIIYRQEQLSS